MTHDTRHTLCGELQHLVAAALARLGQDGHERGAAVGQLVEPGLPPCLDGLELLEVGPVPQLSWVLWCGIVICEFVYIHTYTAS